MKIDVISIVAKKHNCLNTYNNSRNQINRSAGNKIFEISKITIKLNIQSFWFSFNFSKQKEIGNFYPS